MQASQGYSASVQCNSVMLRLQSRSLPELMPVISTSDRRCTVCYRVILPLPGRHRLSLSVQITGGSDPYVIATMGDSAAITSIIWGDVNPTWNETHTLYITDKERDLVRLRVLDKNQLLHDVDLGVVVVSVSELLDNEGQEVRLELKGTYQFEIFQSALDMLLSETCSMSRFGLWASNPETSASGVGNCTNDLVEQQPSLPSGAPTIAFFSQHPVIPRHNICHIVPFTSELLHLKWHNTCTNINSLYNCSWQVPMLKECSLSQLSSSLSVRKCSQQPQQKAHRWVCGLIEVLGSVVVQIGWYPCTQSVSLHMGQYHCTLRILAHWPALLHTPIILAHAQYPCTQ